VPPELLGPTGLTVGVVLGLVALARVIAVLWRIHLEADLDDRLQRDKAQELADKAIAAYDRLGAAWEERNRADAERQRKSD
jgi:hypothetical protein